jgi:drug/metabolite transporter (DMT)-like permease
MVGLPLAVAGGLLASIEKAPAEEVFGLEEGDTVAASGHGALAPPASDGTTTAAVAARPPRRRGTAGAGWALLSSALFAVVILLLDQATALPSVSIAACGRVGTMVVLIPVALLLSGMRVPREFRRRCVLAGVGDAAGFILFTAAIIVGPLAVASVVISQGGTMAVLLGYLALRERLSKVQYVGVACTIGACTLFALG